MVQKRKKKESSRLQKRPPVVVVLGHVDHGKTTLLSAIKEEDLLSKESGGITQHIGAYQVTFKGQKITFIDTPGHKAFAKMRSRGAQVTDMAILVVAADDGVMPQTKESLKHIKAAKVPFFVVINKIDLPAAAVDKVRAQLAEEGVLVEGYGGEVVSIEASAKEKKGINELLEMILLISEMIDLKANPQGKLEAVVIESLLDSFRGPMATLLLKNGTLRIKDEIWTENIFCKVKAMFDEKGKKLKEAHLSQPVQVLGFKKVPPIGSLVTLQLQEKVEEEQDKKEITKEKDKQFKVVLKADTLGVLEAIKNSLSEEVEMVDSGVGEVTESDILMASASQALIIDFRTKVSKKIRELAEREKVEIKSYQVIYRLLEDLEKQVLRLLEPTIDEEVLGEAEVIAEFEIKKDHIAGCRVRKGMIEKKYSVHLKRKEEIIATSKIKSFQRDKQEVVKARVGDEVGIVFSHPLDFKLQDVIVSFRKQESQ